MTVFPEAAGGPLATFRGSDGPVIGPVDRSTTAGKLDVLTSTSAYLRSWGVV